MIRPPKTITMIVPVPPAEYVTRTLSELRRLIDETPDLRLIEITTPYRAHFVRDFTEAVGVLALGYSNPKPIVVVYPPRWTRRGRTAGRLRSWVLCDEGRLSLAEANGTSGYLPNPEQVLERARALRDGRGISGARVSGEVSVGRSPYVPRIVPAPSWQAVDGW